MLLLIYVLLSLYMAVVSLALPVYLVVRRLVDTHAVPEYQELAMLAAFSLNSLLTVTISMFFKFHVGLVMGNSTTIDNMDKKNVQKTNVYDRGRTANWYQVFGRNKWLWLLPITGISGKPIGDGVIWTQENNNIDEEVPGNEVEARRSMPESANEAARVNYSPRVAYVPLLKENEAEAKRKEDADTKPSTDSFRRNNK